MRSINGKPLYTCTWSP